VIVVKELDTANADAVHPRPFEHQRRQAKDAIAGAHHHDVQFLAVTECVPPGA
jgi:hypothetical protein